jgi:hypothetical protein
MPGRANPPRPNPNKRNASAELDPPMQQAVTSKLQSNNVRTGRKLAELLRMAHSRLMISPLLNPLLNPS